MKRLPALMALVLAFAPISGDASHGARTALGSSTANGTAPNGTSFGPTLSEDGRFLAFSSAATDLVARDRNERQDVFVKDLRSGAVERVSVSSAGREGDADSFAPVLSPDGRFVLFGSHARTLARPRPAACGRQSSSCRQIYLHDRQTRETQIVSLDAWGRPVKKGVSSSAGLSADGRRVVFGAMRIIPRAPKSQSSIYVRDLSRRVTRVVSLRPDGKPFTRGTAITGPGSITGDGSRVIFRAQDSNGSRAWVHDLRSGRTVIASKGDKRVYDAVISRDGGAVAVSAYREVQGVGRTVVVAGEPGKRLALASRSTWGDVANGPSTPVAVSGGGRYVLMTSNATNLAPGDVQLCSYCMSDGPCLQVYVHDLLERVTIRVSVGTTGESSRGLSGTSFVRGGVVTAFAGSAPPGLESACSDEACHQVWIHEERVHRQVDEVAPAGVINGATEPIVTTGSLSGSVADDYSGVRSAEITFTPRNEGSLLATPLQYECSNFSARDCSWSVEAPGVPGIYDATLRVVDRAGNEYQTEPVEVVVVRTPS